MLTLDGHVGIDDKSKDRELLIQKILEFGSKVNDFQVQISFVIVVKFIQHLQQKNAL